MSSYFLRFRNIIRDQAKHQLDQQYDAGEIDEPTYRALNKFYDINAEDNTPLNKALCRVIYGTASSEDITALKSYFWN